MPRMKGVNKAKAVRDYLRDHPRAKTRAIAEALAKEGISITAAYASKIKSTGRKRGRPVGSVSAKPGVGIPEVKAALALIKACGSPRAAKKALATAVQIKALV
jgi:hypothetical protein